MHPVEYVDLAREPIGEREAKHTVADDRCGGDVGGKTGHWEWLDLLKPFTGTSATPVLRTAGIGTKPGFRAGPPTAILTGTMKPARPALDRHHRAPRMPHARRPARSRVLAALVVALVILAAVAAAGPFSGGKPADLFPAAVAVGENAVWVANGGAPGTGEASVSRIDPSSHRVLGTTPVGIPTDVTRAAPSSGTATRITGLAVADGAVWVVADNGVLARVDAASGRLTATVRLGGPGATTLGLGGYQLAAGPAGVWASAPDGRVMRLDSSSGRVLHTILVGSNVGAIAVGQSVWVVVGKNDGRVEQIDPSSGAATSTGGPGESYLLAVDSGTVWVGYGVPTLFTTFEQLDTTNGTPVGRPVDLTGGSNGSKVAPGPGALWVLEGSGAVARIAPGLPVPEQLAGVSDAQALAMGSSSLWLIEGDRVYERNPDTGRPIGDPILGA